MKNVIPSAVERAITTIHPVVVAQAVEDTTYSRQKSGRTEWFRARDVSSTRQLVKAAWYSAPKRNRVAKDRANANCACAAADLVYIND